MTGLEVTLLVVTGAVLTLDRWPVLQTMASRPLVVGPLVGFVLGDVENGVLWGAVFEIAFLGILPVGAARYPNETIATVVGTTVAIVGARAGAIPAGWAVAAGLAAAWVGERADRLHRRWNGRLAARSIDDRIGALVALVWFGFPELALVFGLALFVTLFFAAAIGVLIPLALRYFKIDPAVASGVFVTTVTDVFGFFTFLGVATLVLL